MIAVSLFLLFLLFVLLMLEAEVIIRKRCEAFIAQPALLFFRGGLSLRPFP
jgi:hypothetical protein